MIFSAESTSRLLPSRIVSLDFTPDGLCVRTVADLAAEIKQGAHGGAESNLLGQILIVEDISPSAMEMLGLELEIDPFFFASYLHRAWRKSSTQSPLNCTLPSRERGQNFVALYSQRSLTFPSLDSQNRQMVQMGNQMRKVMVLPSARESCIGLAQHHCSVLLKQADGKPWIGKHWAPIR